MKKAIAIGLGLGMLSMLGGCETIFTNEVYMKADAINIAPLIQVDYSQMPEGAVVVESQDHSEFFNKIHDSVVYRVNYPARIVILPLREPGGEDDNQQKTAP